MFDGLQSQGFNYQLQNVHPAGHVDVSAALNDAMAYHVPASDVNPQMSLQEQAVLQFQQMQVLAYLQQFSPRAAPAADASLAEWQEHWNLQAGPTQSMLTQAQRDIDNRETMPLLRDSLAQSIMLFGGYASGGSNLRLPSSNLGGSGRTLLGLRGESGTTVPLGLRSVVNDLPPGMRFDAPKTLDELGEVIPTDAKSIRQWKTHIQSVTKDGNKKTQKFYTLELVTGIMLSGVVTVFKLQNKLVKPTNCGFIK